MINKFNFHLYINYHTLTQSEMVGFFINVNEINITLITPSVTIILIIQLILLKVLMENEVVEYEIFNSHVNKQTHINNEYSLDSFTIMLGKNLVNIKDKSFGKNITSTKINSYNKNELGNVEYYNSKHIYINKDISDDCKTIYELKNNKNTALEEPRQYVHVTLTSKLLGKKYFEGINNHTIQEVYNIIINQGVIDIEYDDFTKSKIYSIDIKKDFECEDFDSLIKFLKNHTKFTQRRDMGYKTHNSINKRGLEFSSRMHNTQGSPFIKFYDKYLESKKNDVEFFEKYFNYSNSIPINLVRFEFTIQNKKNLLNCGFEIDCTLQNILNLTQDSLIQIGEHLLEKHIDYYIIKGKNPIDIIINNCTSILKEYDDNYNVEQMCNKLLDKLSKSSRVTYRKKIIDGVRNFADEDIDDTLPDMLKTYLDFQC